MNIRHFFTANELAMMDELDIGSNSSSGHGSGSGSGSSREQDLSLSRHFQLSVKQHSANVHDLAFECELGHNAPDRYHYLHVGFGTGRRPCVTLTLTAELPSSCTLQHVVYSSSCCIGGGMPHGHFGTVPMVRGALLAAAQLEPFRHCCEVCINDTSHKPGTGTSCSDVHMILHASMMTWYEEEFGAVVCAPWAERLSATRAALSQPVNASAQQFADKVLPVAQAVGLLPWWRRSEAAVKTAFLTVASGGGSSWAQLFASLATQFADKHASFLRMLLALLAKGELCPGWTSCTGFGWAIPMSSIRSWTHVSISLHES